MVQKSTERKRMSTEMSATTGMLKTARKSTTTGTTTTTWK